MYHTTHFSGAKKYWHMGKLYDWNSSHVHVMSHALHYGSSVFEGIRAYNTDTGTAIFRLEDHIKRFAKSANVLNMELPYSQADIIDVCKLVIRENALSNAYIRPNLFYGYGNLGLTPSACAVELTIGCWEWGAYLGAEGVSNGVKILLLPWKRLHHSQIDLSVKLGGVYVQSNICATYARQQGFNEGVFLNLEGRIAEGPGENIIIIKNGILKTNDKRESILEGFTRTTILQLAADLGYQTEISPITIEDFLNADEAFFTGTAAEVTPIIAITDGRDRFAPKEQWPYHQIGNGTPGEITLRLGTLYGEVVRGQHPQYQQWLSYV